MKKLLATCVLSLLFCIALAAGPLNVSGDVPFRLAASANTTNPTVVKASPGTLMSVVVINVDTTVAFLKFYDKATAPTVGTDTPVYTVPLNANNAVTVAEPPEGVRFINGISFGLTTDIGDSGTTAVAANKISLSGTYK